MEVGKPTFDIDLVSEDLAKSTFLDDILYELYEKSIISDKIANVILGLQSTKINQAKILLQYISKCEKSLQKFVEALCSKGLYDLAYNVNPELTKKLRPSNCDSGDLVHIVPYIPSSASLPTISVTPRSSIETSKYSQSCPKGLDQTASGPLTIRVKPSIEIFYSHEDEVITNQIYKNITMPRGLVFIANFETFDYNAHPKRDGSEVDVQNLTELFTQMGYLVLPPKRNLKRYELLNELRAFRDNDKLWDVDSSIVVIMSHGLDNQLFYTSDNLTINAKKVVELFNNKECCRLIDKPKVFIFNFCRGKSIDFGVERHTLPMMVSNEIDSSRVLETTDGISHGETIDISAGVADSSDILVIYSCLEGYVSNRNSETGSWLMEEICLVFMEYALNTDFERMMKLVNHRMMNRGTGRKQPFEIRNIAFNKPFYLNPAPLKSNDFPSVIELSSALPHSASASSLNRRSWNFESRCSTPELFSEPIHPETILPTRLRHWSGGSNSPCLSRDVSPFSPRGAAELRPSVRPKSVSSICNAGARKSRRASTPIMPEHNTLDVNMRTVKDEDIVKISNCPPRLQVSMYEFENGSHEEKSSGDYDVVDTVPRKRTITAPPIDDFTKWRREKCREIPAPEESTRLKRSLSGPNETEALKSVKGIRDYITINEHDHLLELLGPIEAQLQKDKNKGKRRKEESNSLEY